MTSNTIPVSVRSHAEPLESAEGKRLNSIERHSKPHAVTGLRYRPNHRHPRDGDRLAVSAAQAQLLRRREAVCAAVAGVST